jgi:hypothetical protein
MIAYRVPGRPAEAPAFYTFAFLLDELGGVLASQDPDEQVESFREVELIELPAMAEHLSYTPDGYHPEISGSWRSWGMFRAVAHHAVVDALRPRWSYRRNSHCGLRNYADCVCRPELAFLD